MNPVVVTSIGNGVLTLGGCIIAYSVIRLGLLFVNMPIPDPVVRAHYDFKAWRRGARPPFDTSRLSGVALSASNYWATEIGADTGRNELPSAYEDAIPALRDAGFVADWDSSGEYFDPAWGLRGTSVWVTPPLSKRA